MCWVGDRRLCTFSILVQILAMATRLTDHDPDIVPAPLGKLQWCDLLPDLFDRLYWGDLPDGHRGSSAFCLVKNELDVTIIVLIVISTVKIAIGAP